MSCNEQNNSDSKIVTLEELAAYVKVSPHTIRRWMHRGYLMPMFNIGSIKRFNLQVAIEQMQKIPSPKRSSAFKSKPNRSDDEIANNKFF